MYVSRKKWEKLIKRITDLEEERLLMKKNIRSHNKKICKIKEKIKIMQEKVDAGEKIGNLF